MRPCCSGASEDRTRKTPLFDGHMITFRCGFSHRAAGDWPRRTPWPGRTRSGPGPSTRRRRRPPAPARPSPSGRAGRSPRRASTCRSCAAARSGLAVDAVAVGVDQVQLVEHVRCHARRPAAARPSGPWSGRSAPRRTGRPASPWPGEVAGLRVGVSAAPPWRRHQVTAGSAPACRASRPSRSAIDRRCSSARPSRVRATGVSAYCSAKRRNWPSRRARCAAPGVATSWPVEPRDRWPLLGDHPAQLASRGRTAWSSISSAARSTVVQQPDLVQHRDRLAPELLGVLARSSGGSADSAGRRVEIGSGIGWRRGLPSALALLDRLRLAAPHRCQPSGAALAQPPPQPPPPGRVHPVAQVIAPDHAPLVDLLRRAGHVRPARRRPAYSTRPAAVEVVGRSTGTERLPGRAAGQAHLQAVTFPQTAAWYSASSTCSFASRSASATAEPEVRVLVDQVEDRLRS